MTPVEMLSQESKIKLPPGKKVHFLKTPPGFYNIVSTPEGATLEVSNFQFFGRPEIIMEPGYWNVNGAWIQVTPEQSGSPQNK